MDERNKEAVEKDLDHTTNECDGSGSFKDTCNTDQESQLHRRNSDEAKIRDKEVTEESNATKGVSSNGFDSDIKAVDKNLTDGTDPSQDMVSDLELLQSDIFESNSKQEAVEDDNTDDKSKLGTDTVPNEENSENIANVVQSISFNLNEDRNEVNNSLVLPNENWNDSSVTRPDDKDQNLFLLEVNTASESCEMKQTELENSNQSDNICNKDIENSDKFHGLPYEEVEGVKDLEVNSADNSILQSENGISNSKDTEDTEKLETDAEDKGAFSEKLILEHENPSDTGISEHYINEESKESKNESHESLTPMDVDSENPIQSDNPFPESINELNQDILAPKSNLQYDAPIILHDNPIESCVSESQTNIDRIDNEMKCVHEKNLAFSPKDIFENQPDEMVASKNDLLSTHNERNEILNTEMVNCNEDSQMELNEIDKDAEVNNIDVDQNEETEKKQDDLEIEEMVMDKSGGTENSDKDLEKKDQDTEMKDQYLTEDTEAEKQIGTVDENEALIQPGGSEEETITGDTSNEEPLNDTRGKDAEMCIIPDDVTPRLTIPPHSSHEKTEQDSGKDANNCSTKEEVKIIKVATVDLEKAKEKDEEKVDGESGVKTRPVRVAAKLAGNKIKSLVQSDFAPDTISAKRNSETGDDAKCDESTSTCVQCRRIKTCKFQVIQGGRTQLLCSDQCYNTFVKGTQPEMVDVEPGTHVRKCSQCHVQVTGDENTLSWETMDFCNEECLGKYQMELGSNCANCKGNVASVSLGKYCVRFGYDVKQFCTSSCLEEYKKGLKVCSYCQKDISTGTEGFLAPVGDKGQFKDFCTQSCMEKYEQMSSNTPPPSVIAECAVCSNSKPVKVEVTLDNKIQKLCSEPCFAAFKFVNNIREGQCDMCKKYFDRVKTGNFSIYYEDSPHSFCCKTCMNVYILANRKIVPCNWCKVKKYNFDMIKKVSVTGQILMMCSLNCLTLYQVSVNAVSSRRTMCDFCLTFAQAKYHLTMSDATIRNFCSYACVMSFQNQYPKQALSLPSTERLTSPIPTGGPKRILPRRSQVNTPSVPVISSVQSLASPNGPVSGTRVSIPGTEVGLVSQVASISQPITIQPAVSALPAPPPPQVYQQIITKPAPVKQQKNKSVLCKPYSHTKSVSCRPHPCMKETQTDESLNRKYLIPIPIPIYVPAPMHMWASPFPVLVPFPLPIPVPIFLPTTRNSAKGIFKEIKRIQEKIPTDPFEAELLMMAEMVAGEKKQDPTDSESEDGNDGDDGGDGTFSPENVDTSNTFGEDMLQIALKMATELEEPAVDMESVLTSNTITPSSQPTVDPNKGLYASDPDDPDQVQVLPMSRGRKRSMRGSRNSSGGTQSKRGRRISGSNVDVPMLPPPEPVPPPRIEVEKPDANMCLKYTFGVNAWRHWVMQKNAELEKAALTNRKIKLFKPDLLQLTADELNFSLCLFVKEVRKPNGAEYAPDTIYYLCLGIQQYLFENGRIDNIFTDSYYEKFTDCLDEVAKKFAALYNDSQYIVTRVEEEHLWESKQLGAHSPHVLLSTLMFFNTKHFNLVTVEEHMQLSFSHIMKHWKRNPNAPGVAKVPGSRNVLLRFYPPQSALEANSRKKKVYEQQENEENPLRCPVKLYEFYLSKCPESVKTRNDVFYLLPERSCVPDSPVWYSTMALGKEPLTKMLHRVKMVKEINIALLSC